MTHPEGLEPAIDNARTVIRDVQSSLQQQGLSLRPPPPEPSTCCARGCQGCVWESYFDAVVFWRDDAVELIKTRA